MLLQCNYFEHVKLDLNLYVITLTKLSRNLEKKAGLIYILLHQRFPIGKILTWALFSLFFFLKYLNIIAVPSQIWEKSINLPFLMILLCRGFTARTAVKTARAISTMVTHVLFSDGIKSEEEPITILFGWSKFGWY